MRRLAYARNRQVDHEPRQIIISDDEAVTILEALTAVRVALAAWDADDDQEKNDLSEELWEAIAALRLATEAEDAT